MTTFADGADPDGTAITADSITAAVSITTAARTAADPDGDLKAARTAAPKDTGRSFPGRSP
jgi:hypothetical protein